MSKSRRIGRRDGWWLTNKREREESEIEKRESEGEERKGERVRERSER